MLIYLTFLILKIWLKPGTIFKFKNIYNSYRFYIYCWTLCFKFRTIRAMNLNWFLEVILLVLRINISSSSNNY